MALRWIKAMDGEKPKPIHSKKDVERKLPEGNIIARPSIQRAEASKTKESKCLLTQSDEKSADRKQNS
jgi:hypothetical protein